MCKKRAIWPQAEGKYGVKWGTCVDRPTGAICDDILPAPPGYKDDFVRKLYVNIGTTLNFKCAKEGFLAGDAEKISYT